MAPRRPPSRDRRGRPVRRRPVRRRLRGSATGPGPAAGRRRRSRPAHRRRPVAAGRAGRLRRRRHRPPRRTATPHRGEGRHRRFAPPGPDEVDDAPVQSLHRGRPVRQQAGGRVGGVRHRGVAEGDQHLVRGVGDQPDRRPGDHRQRALGPGQELGHVEPTLGQQVLEAVARHLPGKGAELGPDRSQPRLHHLLQRGQRRRTGQVRAGTQAQVFSGPGDHLEADDVVGRPAVPLSPRPAGVVADHAADGAAVVGGRVRAEAQTVRGGRGLQRGLHHARLDPNGVRVRVEVADRGQMSRGVDHQARTDGVAGTRRPRPPGGDRYPGGAGLRPTRRAARRRPEDGRPRRERPDTARRRRSTGPE